MPKEIPKEGFMNIGDLKVLAEELRRSIQINHKNRCYIAALCIIACSIHRFAGGNIKKGEQREYYCGILEKYFPELCKKLPASEFYKIYRHGIVKAFSPLRGYAMCEDHELDGEYIGVVRIQGQSKDRIGLNMDRLTNDFIAMCHKVIKDGKV
jgi:hypothetical protein